ncbi:MAG TPA: SDR family NAD(P)-dependent oxidoreductase [Candidatus Nanopelagicales bacterium]|nr:SDR family NAD(P)-dependent oxidoreductase [Candidatus Nanopelagicales bacterium]
MSFSLTGRVALVTGASRGIGRAIALGYAAAGADVALLSRDPDRLAAVAGEIGGHGRRAAIVPADVLDPEAFAAAVAAAVEQLGRLDVLVNNAGGNSFSVPLQDMRMSGWQKTMRLNLDSVVYACQAALPHLTATGGSILNVASVAGLRGAPLMSHYGAAKAAVLSLTQSLALEVAHTGVRVNALVPGWIQTDLTGFLRADEATEQGLLSRVPMARWGTPEEIAEPAVFLASDAARFITGQALVVDGGLSAMP